MGIYLRFGRLGDPGRPAAGEASIGVWPSAGAGRHRWHNGSRDRRLAVAMAHGLRQAEAAAAVRGLCAACQAAVAAHE